MLLLSTYDQVMTDITGVDVGPPDLAKHEDLNTFPATNSVTVSGETDSSQAIVIGGGL